MNSYLKFSKGRVDYRYYLDYLANKDVALVGPAGYMVGKKLGAKIDEHEIVIRINHAIPIKHPADYGTKTDVLYHILSHIVENRKIGLYPQEVRQWQEAGVEWIVSRYRGGENNRIKNAITQLELLFNGRWVSNQHIFKTIRDTKGLMNRQDKIPNTGIIALVELVKAPTKKVTVYGMDLYKSQIYDGYGDIKPEFAQEHNEKVHDLKAQAIFLDKFLKENKNKCKIDKNFKEAIEFWKMY